MGAKYEIILLLSLETQEISNATILARSGASSVSHNFALPPVLVAALRVDLRKLAMPPPRVQLPATSRMLRGRLSSNARWEYFSKPGSIRISIGTYIGGGASHSAVEIIGFLARIAILQEKY